MERNTASVRAADEQLDALLGHRGAATVSLLFALSDGAKRFGVLRSQMGRMSQKTLVAELRALEQLGAVERIVFAEIPPRVEYSLTAAGVELVRCCARWRHGVRGAREGWSDMAVRTKQAIRQAFIELLNERPLDKISVKDIAERSTVNRNTFYYYYADIYALVEEIFQTETQLFMEKLHSYASWEEAFREATAFVSENKRAVHHLFNSGNRNILEHYYHKVTYAAMLSYVRGQAEGLSAAEEDIQSLAQFYAAALSGMTADWLRGGMKSNVNDHIDRLGRLLEGNIRQALERSCR